MSGDIPILSVVIISINNSRLQENLPNVIATTRFTSAEIILVCQGYTPNFSYIDSAVNIRVLHTPELLGISRARNCGADYAVGEFISFLDDDVRPDPNFFQLTLDFLKKTPSAIGVLGSIQVNGNVNAPLFRKFRRPAMVEVSTFTIWRLANGNSGVFRRTGARCDIRLGVGTYYGSCEDVDYLFALSRIGSIAFMPNALIYHPDMDESETRDSARVRSYSRGIGGCFAKNANLETLSFLLISILNNLISLIRPRAYPNLRARWSHLDSIVYKVLAIMNWYRHANSMPKVELDNLCVTVIVDAHRVTSQ